jgi:Rrf2 family transcriptional regulator, nitric oxide-sensitive transcriptional repressor
MQLTLFSDYSLRVLLYLAAHRADPVPISQISAAYGISQNHLVKVVQRLIELGLLQSVRGRSGGLRLAREPSDINVAEVVRATEPHMNLVECFDAGRSACPIDPACGLKRALRLAQHAFFAELERYCLADFMTQAPALLKLWNRKPQTVSA